MEVLKNNRTFSRQQSIFAVHELMTALFKGEWEENSAWVLLQNVKEEVGQLTIDNVKSEIEVAYFQVLLGFLDKEWLLAMEKHVREIKDALGSIVKTDSTKVNPPKPLPAVWLEFGKTLELTPKGINELFVQASLGGETVERGVLSGLQQLAAEYEKGKVFFRLIAATLLCYLPEGTPAFTKEWDPHSPISAGAMRFLGQSFFNHETEAIQKSFQFLREKASSIPPWKNQDERFFYTVLLYLVFSDFNKWSVEQQGDLLKSCGWWALVQGIPLETIIGDALVEAPLPTAYVVQSGTLAQKLGESALIIERIGSEMSVGKFLEGFTQLSGTEERATEKQVAYIDELIKKNRWPITLSGGLQRILVLYINLRDCTLIDYDGLLSDDGVVQKKYNWSELLTKDLSDKEIDQIKSDLTKLHRPVRTKMEMILAFESVPWSTEPYLQRVLTLSDVYLEAFSGVHGPLAYFDEASGGWQMNKEFSDVWGIRSYFDQKWSVKKTPNLVSKS